MHRIGWSVPRNAPKPKHDGCDERRNERTVEVRRAWRCEHIEIVARERVWDGEGTNGSKPRETHVMDRRRRPPKKKNKKKTRGTGSWSSHDRVVTRFVIDRAWVCVSRLVDPFRARFLAIDPLVFRRDRVRPCAIFRFGRCDPVSSKCNEGWFRSTRVLETTTVRQRNETKR